MISNDEITIVVNPEKIEIQLQDNSQNIFVTAESITVQTNALLTAGAGDTYVIGETPTGNINGSNATFTTLNAFVPLSTELILNSTIQTYGVDYYTTGTNTIILYVSPVVGDIIRVNYKQG
jgi:hypothetical protein